MIIPRNETLYSGTAVASGNSRSTPVLSEFAREAAFFLDITAKSGTSPTLDVVIKIYDKLTAKWYTLATFDQKSTVTTDVGYVQYGLGDKIACDYTIGGTNPSFTFQVTVALKEYA